MENWESTLYLIAAVQGFLLSFALLAKNKKQHSSNPYLGLILIILSLELLLTWAMSINYFSKSYSLPFWLFQSYLILPPSLLIFILLNAHISIEKRTLWILFVPSFIEIIVETTHQIYFRLTGVVVELLSYKLWFLFSESLPILGMCVVIFYYGKLLFFDKNENAKNIQNLKHYLFFAAFFLLTLFWIAVMMIEIPELYAYINFGLMFFIFTLGYLAFFNPGFFEISKLRKSNFEAFDDKQELLKLERIFEDNKLYLEPRLTLSSLSKELGLPQRYVSYLINTYHKTNFHSYVNGFRIKEVIEKIRDPSEAYKSLLALALESGFNSKSSFNQIFKEHTGKLPSDYLPKI